MSASFLGEGYNRKKDAIENQNKSYKCNIKVNTLRNATFSIKIVAQLQKIKIKT